MNNPHRIMWINDAENWCRKHNISVQTKPIKTKCVCPRCGLDTIELSQSQYEDYEICANCCDDEIIRDSLGVNQVVFKDWYVNTRVKLGYLKTSR